ncbi:unnamed protein product [Rotaria sp. Silwood1]|nr:unnamed protein product [Rotaria sp. Silwood1]CAF1057292.1 unnamed protein product [Rotaria sp. Silwood1]
MGDIFDPLNSTANKASTSLNTHIDKNKSNTDGSPYRPTYKSVWTRQASTDMNRQMSLPGEQNSQVYIIEQKTKPYWETGEGSFEEWHQDQAEGYGTEQRPTYYQEGYYEDEKSYKKKGIAAKIDRLAQRFPVLGKFYKQPPNSPNNNESGQDFNYNRMSNSVISNSIEYKITADDLALNERYSDKTRIQNINLQAYDQTQPVDISIHHEKNKIYLCDIGRSVVQIFDINGTLEHVINGKIMSKFQPTAIAVAFDGTLILASHFNHCLHMYLPNDTQNQSNCYSYKQFKLGTEGHQIHQFYNPAGITIDKSDGYLYVCDRGNYRIQVITPDGLCERIIELYLNDKKKYPLDPVRIALQPNSEHIVCIIGAGDAICFIPKYTNGAIQVDPLCIVDANGLGLENASGLAVDNHDRIFIADTGHHRIVICTPDGCFLTSFGMEGDGLGQLKRPCGLDVTNDGAIVVTDSGNKRIQLFGLARKQTSVENNPSKENSNINNQFFPAEEFDSAATL